MEYFRRDNTKGYDALELMDLNAAWRELPVSASDNLDAQKHVSAELLYHFDKGLRGEELVEACL